MNSQTPTSYFDRGKKKPLSDARLKVLRSYIQAGHHLDCKFLHKKKGLGNDKGGILRIGAQGLLSIHNRLVNFRMDPEA